MNSHLFIVVSLCISISKIIALPAEKFHELSDKIAEFQDNENNGRANYYRSPMANGNVYGPKAGWFGYSDKTDQFFTKKVELWPGTRIPYVIERSFDNAEYNIIMEAINDFHKYTCIRFVPYTGERAYIHIIPSESGCHSTIGYTGDYYNVHLMSPICTKHKGPVMHELMHALGFIHEQCRHDRDNYVDIQWNNIQYGNKANFHKFEDDILNNYGLPYDFGSLMHYPDNAFSSNGKKTITPKAHFDTKMGPSNGFSQYDIVKIKKLYKC